MDQLFAVFGVNWKLLIIQLINFGVLLFILSRVLYRPLMRIIDERQKKIAEGVRTAEEAALKLASAESEGKQIVGSAAREAEGLVAVARNRADERAREIVQAAESRADAALKDAALKAEEAKRQALEESKQEIARAAMLAAERILKTKSQ
jgi:F-type H+-transporting ATPase subunit b